MLAGAGSGKTRVLTYRIAHMIADEGVRPWQVLAITFTNKAAAEMRERLEALLGGGTRGMWVCTFHAMCVRIDALARTRVPVLLVHGEGDAVVPVSMARELAAAGTGHELMTFAGAGHCCAVFADPGRYWDGVLGFVGRWA